MKVVASIALLLFAFSFGMAQKIEKKFDKGHFDPVINKLKKQKTRSAEDNFYIAEAYRRSNRLKQSTPYYKEAISKGIDKEVTHLYYAKALEANEKYKEAEKVLENYISFAEDEEVSKLAQGELNGLLKLEELIEKGSFYKVKNLATINTPSTEYSPIYNNGKLYFTSNRDGGKIYLTTGTPFTKLYEVNTKGAVVEMNSLKPLDPLFNDPNTNEGSIAISKAGNSIIYAKGNPGKANGTENVNLYFSRFRNGKWSEPRILNVCDPRAWDSSPALSADGRTLYFASNRKGGFGGTDIYVAKLNSRGRWVDVRNLGPAINTEGNEMFPFVSDDGKLYFSSDGHAGFGQLDIFVATRERGVVTVENLGTPINSSSDDFGYHEFNATKGFFSSNRAGGQGDDDIYTYVNNDPDLKIVNYYLTGVTVTLDDGGKEVILPNSKVTLMAENDEILDEAFTGSDGKFRFRVFPEEDYNLVAEKNSYFTTRKDFSTVGKSVDRTKLEKFVTNVNFETKIFLDPIVIDKTIVLENIYYDLNKANIRPDAALELDKLVTLLNDNPDISIELSSHTDARAPDDYNMDLSARRAKSAVNYLVSKGISAKRMTDKGYGETRLIIKDAKTEEEHQVNRRTEFKVIRYNQKIEREQTDYDETDRFFDGGGSEDEDTEETSG